MTRDRSTNPDDYEDWPIDNPDEREYVGMLPTRTPVFYTPETGLIHRGAVDEEARQLVPHEESSWELNPGETVGELLERIDDEVGWESLSSFAEEHLEGDSDSGSQSESA